MASPELLRGKRIGLQSSPKTSLLPRRTSATTSRRSWRSCQVPPLLSSPASPVASRPVPLASCLFVIVPHASCLMPFLTIHSYPPCAPLVLHSNNFRVSLQTEDGQPRASAGQETNLRRGLRGGADGAVQSRSHPLRQGLHRLQVGRPIVIILLTCRSRRQPRSRRPGREVAGDGDMADGEDGDYEPQAPGPGRWGGW